MISPHTKMNSTEATDVASVKAARIESVVYSSTSPGSRQAQENSRPLAGTFCADSLPKLRGAFRSSASP